MTDSVLTQHSEDEGDVEGKIVVTETNMQRFFEMWVNEARNMTVERLGTFITHLTEDYTHDYSSICYATIAAALAAGCAIDNSKQGGITGFQAGYIANMFVRKWLQYGTDEPIAIRSYRDLLFPQYDDKFTTIDQETWDYLQREAAKLLTEPYGVPQVRDHWQSIVDGQVPFGYRVL